MRRRGCLWERAPGVWSIVVSLGRDADGQRIRRYHPFTGTRREAEAELTRILREVDTGGYVEPSKITLAEFCRQWLAEYAPTRLSPKTADRYADLLEAHVIPELGHHPVSKLQPLHIQRFYRDRLAHGRKDGHGGLAPLTVLHIHRLLHKVLEQAIRWQILARNPVDLVDPPRVARPELEVYSAADIERLLDACRPDSVYVPVTIAVWTGMRQGEIAGLKWGDVDLDQATITVQRSICQSKRMTYVKAPKSASGRRQVAISQQLVRVLREHKGTQAALKMHLGDAYRDEDWVCANGDGSVTMPSNISTRFRLVVRRHGLPRLTFHGLRHTHAAMLLVSGTHPKVVSERLGHSSIGITMDLYAHVMPTLQRAAADALDAILQPKPSQNGGV